MATKANSIPCQAPEMEFFHNTAFRGELKILPNI